MGMFVNLWAFYFSIVSQTNALSETNSVCSTNVPVILQTNTILQKAEKKLENRVAILPLSQISLPLNSLDAVAFNPSDRTRLTQISLILRIPVVQVSGESSRGLDEVTISRQRSDFMTSVSQDMKQKKFTVNSNLPPILPHRILPLEAAFSSTNQAAYASAFLAPGRVLGESRLASPAPLLLFKDFSDKTGMLKEMINALIWKQRSQRGLEDPWSLNPHFQNPDDYEFLKEDEQEEFLLRPTNYMPKLFERSQRFYDQLAIQYDAQWLIFQNSDYWGFSGTVRKAALENMHAILGSIYEGGMDGSMGLVKLVSEVSSRLEALGSRPAEFRDPQLDAPLREFENWLQQRKTSIDAAYAWLQKQN
jgi:hypothetical protein